MRTARLGQVCLWFMLVAGLLANCSPKSTPPGANSVGGSVDGVVLYSYHYWEEGLAILIWHDFSYGESGCRGSGSTEDPVYRLVCDVEARDGRRFNWEGNTRDGVTAQMWINGESYDLAQGAMFLVSSQDDKTTVVQLQRDLSQLHPDNESILSLADSDSDVANFVTSVEAP